MSTATPQAPLVDVKSGPDVLSSEKRKRLLAELSKSASYCHVFRNIWIGDIGSAAGVASGDLANFTCVFNASGRESRGLSLLPEYAARGVRYDTLMDVEAGLTLSDTAESVTAEGVAEMMARNHDIIPSVAVAGTGGTTLAVHSTQICTDATFIHFMHEANRKIAALAKNEDDHVLVHCYAGVNRSASAIVAYAMLSHGWKFSDIVETIVEAVFVRRRVAALTNNRFRQLLEKRVVPGGADAARKAYVAERTRIFELAEKVRGERKAAKKVRKFAAAAAVRQKLGTVGAPYDCDEEKTTGRWRRFTSMSSWEIALESAVGAPPRGFACRSCGVADVDLAYCAGCGRNAGICYCSRACQLADFVFGKHYRICGRR